MSFILDTVTEQRIQRQIDLGRYADPAEVINHALDLLAAEEAWSDDERAELDAHLARSQAQFDRGEIVSGEGLREALSELRSTHAR